MFIKKNEKELWLTSRNLNSFIVVNLKKMKAELKTISLSTTALIHDGFHYKKNISSDGKNFNN